MLNNDDLDKLSKTLYRMAMRLCRDHHLAEDLVQDTLAKAWGALTKHGPRPQNPIGWMREILTNSFLDHVRRQQRRRRLEDAYPTDMPGVVDVSDACDQVGAISDDVARALRNLRDDHRAVVELVDLRGLSYEAAAESLAIPFETVGTRLHRARRLLEAELRDYAAKTYGIRRRSSGPAE